MPPPLAQGGVERNLKQLVEEDLWESLDRAFHAYEEPLEVVTLFKYLGRLLTAVDDDCPVVVDNLRKDRKSWVQMTRVLIRKGRDPKVLGLLFKAVVHAELLFGVETWVLIPG